LEVVLSAGRASIARARTDAAGRAVFEVEASQFSRWHSSLAIEADGGASRQSLRDEVAALVGPVEALLAAQRARLAQEAETARQADVAERARAVQERAVAEQATGRCSPESRALLDHALEELEVTLRDEATGYRRRYLTVLDHEFVVLDAEGGSFRLRGLGDHLHVLVLSPMPFTLSMRDGHGTEIQQVTEWAGSWRSTVHADGRELHAARDELFDLRLTGVGCAVITLIDE
jgi:hypothetical protein